MPQIRQTTNSLFLSPNEWRQLFWANTTEYPCAVVTIRVLKQNKETSKICSKCQSNIFRLIVRGTYSTIELDQFFFILKLVTNRTHFIILSLLINQQAHGGIGHFIPPNNLMVHCDNIADVTNHQKRIKLRHCRHWRTQKLILFHGQWVVVHAFGSHLLKNASLSHWIVSVLQKYSFVAAVPVAFVNLCFIILLNCGPVNQCMTIEFDGVRCAAKSFYIAETNTILLWL